MVQLFAALRILHQLFFLLQHGGKAARRFQIDRNIVRFFCRRFRPRRCLGGCGSFLRGTVILSSQVKLFRFFVHPCTQPAIADESAHPLEGTGLFLVHGFQRQALLQSKPSAASARRSSVLLAFRRVAPAVIIHTNTAVTAAKHQPVIRTAPSAKLPMAAAFSAIKLSCRRACRTAALGVNRPAAPRQETAVMPKITVNVMPTASNAQPAL